MRRSTLSDGLELFHLNLEETRFVHDEIFTDRTYLRHGITLSDGACVVDVGANVGLFALFVHRHYEHTRIIAIEPVPEVFEALSANADLHQLDARLFCCALGAAPGEATFTFYPHNSVMSGMHADDTQDRATTRTFLRNKNPTLFEGAAANPATGRYVDAMFSRLFQSRTFTVPVRTLSSILAEAGATRVDLLKIDVEKAEHEVIAGIAPTDWPAIRQLVVEVHDTAGRLAALRSQLTDLGYAVEVEQDPVLASTDIWALYALRA
jgi:FkbM family methyltransferase